MPDKNIEKAKKLFLEKGLSYAAIASLLGVSSRTVERWSAKGDWKLHRDSQELASQALAPAVAEVLENPVEASAVRPHLNSIVPEAIVELALSMCHADLEDDELRHRNRGQVIESAEKMVKLRHQLSLHRYELELKRIDIEVRKADLQLKLNQLNPPTIEDWADQGAAFSQSAEVLWNEIKKACQRALGT
jgi:predicted transcriptional regulator